MATPAALSICNSVAAKNGSTFLNSTAVFAAPAVDQVFGDNGQGWFLTNLTNGVLNIIHRTSNEAASDI